MGIDGKRVIQMAALKGHGGKSRRVAKRRGRGFGTLVKKGHVYLARWVVTLDSGKKQFSRSTQTGNLEEAQAKLEEFTAPFRLGTQEKILRCQVAELTGVQEKLRQMEEQKPAMGLLAAWMAYRNAPNRPDTGADTLEMYESQYGRFVTWMQEHHPEVKELRKVTEAMAFEFASELGRTVSANTYNKYLVLFRRMWKILAKPAGLGANPWLELNNKLLCTHSRRELTVEELTRVCGSVSGEMRTLFAVGVYCGLRLGDAARLDWGCVDLVRRVVRITPGKTARRANGKVVSIPLHPSLLAILSDTPPERRTGRVMPEAAALYDHDDRLLAKRIKKVFKACGIETNCKVEGRSKMAVEVGFHSLRHSFVSLSANAGANLAAVQAVIGHTNAAMTRHYLHADQENVKQAVALLPNVTGVMTEGELESLAKERLRKAVEALDGLTEEQLKAVADAVGERQKKLTEQKQAVIECDAEPVAGAA